MEETEFSAAYADYVRQQQEEFILEQEEKEMEGRLYNRLLKALSKDIADQITKILKEVL